MTKMEAARILDPETRVEALAEIEYHHGFNGEAAKTDALIEACRIAASLLRAQQEQRKNEPLTNADRIRAMSDDELAKTLYRMQKNVCCCLAAAVGIPLEGLVFANEAPDLLDWLRQPAGGADNENL